MIIIEIGQSIQIVLGGQDGISLILMVPHVTPQVVLTIMDLPLQEEWVVMDRHPLEERRIPATLDEDLLLGEGVQEAVLRWEGARSQVGAPRGVYWSLLIHYQQMAPQEGDKMHLLQALVAVASVLDGEALLLGEGEALGGHPLKPGEISDVVILVPETATTLLQLEVGQ